MAERLATTKSARVACWPAAWLPQACGFDRERHRWDMHRGIFPNLKDRALPELEWPCRRCSPRSPNAVCGVKTVVACGELGRTPKINMRGGRDHWPRAMFLADGWRRHPRRPGHGATRWKGMGPRAIRSLRSRRPSVYQTLGIDYHKEYHTNTGRPVMIVSRLAS